MRILYPIYLFFLFFIPLLILMAQRTPFPSSGFRKVIALCLRILSVLLLTLSLANLSLSRTLQQVHALFLLDRSASISQENKQQALDFVRRTMIPSRKGDMAGLIVFGEEAFVEIPLQEGPYLGSSGSVGPISSEIGDNQTNIAGALQLALANFPSEGAKRIVLLSDGNETSGDALSLLSMLQALGVEIYSVPLVPHFQNNEVVLEALTIPTKVRIQEPFQLRVTLSSLKEAPTKVILTRDGKFLRSEEVWLKPGINTFSFQDRMETGGLRKTEAVVVTSMDTITENNRSLQFTEVLGAPKILLVTDKKAEANYLSRALIQQGFDVVIKNPLELPHTFSEYLSYEAILFDNVQGFDISLSKMGLIKDYVKHAGGGVIMVGGEHSFGAGGYYKTPIEELLPVHTDVTARMKIPSLALVFVIDKSASMGGPIEEESKLEVAKIAAISAIELLNPFDKVGLLAFDTNLEWVIPLTEAGNRNQIIKQVLALKSGGGTDLYKALEEGIRFMEGVEARIKHLIVLSDGLTDKKDFASLISEVSGKNITISTLALGNDADKDLMQQIAIWGAGRSYYTDNLSNIPRIFISETILVSRGLMVEENIQPVVQEKHEILQGLVEAEQVPSSLLPRIQGYVLTYPKASARVPLVSRQGDPLLATWRYGLGKTVAFTSTLDPRWGSSWVTWEHFSRFAAQMVRWCQKPETSDSIQGEVTLEPDGPFLSKGRGILRVEARSPEGKFLNGLHLQAAVLSPKGEERMITLRQVAPGQYMGTFKASDPGEYYLHVVGQEGSAHIGARSFGVAVPYSQEYTTLSPNMKLLEGLAQGTGGKILDASDPPSAYGEIFKPAKVPSAIHQPLWPYLSLSALLLFVLDILVRKLRWPGSSSS